MYPNQQPPSFPPPPVPSARPGWARKRILIPALALSWLIGAAMGGAGASGSPEPEKAGAAPRPTATSTVTETATAEAEPAPTVTETKKVKVRTTATATATVTAKAPAADSGAGDSNSVHYGNCSEARAAGAAPVHRGEPGYGRHLDRDGDGVGCDI